VIRRAAVSVPIAATREAAWSLLTDHEQSAAWLPGVTAVRALTTEGDIAVIELIVEGGPLVLEVVASPPNGARFEQVDRSGAAGVSGRWSLRDDAAEGLVLDAEIRVPQPLLAFAARRRLRTALEDAAKTVANRLRRPPTAQLAAYRRALAVIRRGNVIEAHIGDQVVELLRIGGEG
jgi:carbon monoxide dehydrogenase subunit G